MVNNTTRAKMRKKSQNAEKNYVNENEYFVWNGAVENPCGKVCGECGKLMVFNRYFVSLHRRSRCITGRIMRGFHRLHRHYVIAERKGIPGELWRKSWACCESGCKKRGTIGWFQKIFGKNAQILLRYELGTAGDTEWQQRKRSQPEESACRER